MAGGSDACHSGSHRRLIRSNVPLTVTNDTLLPGNVRLTTGIVASAALGLLLRDEVIIIE